MTKPFTGRHMLIVMLAFFGTVIVVNLVMATLATRTFGGTVVDNSYVASQRFNTWLGEARAQQALGWDVAVVMEPGRHVVATLAGDEAPLEGATISAVASHPVGREPDVSLRFMAVGQGRYRTTEPLPVGRWNLRLSIVRGEDRLRLVESLQ